jgi:CRP/FNR family transcriptional regulator
MVFTLEVSISLGIDMNALPSTMPSPTAAAQAVIAGPHRGHDSSALGHGADEAGAGLRHAVEMEDQFKSRARWRASLDMIERQVPVAKRRFRTHQELYTFGQPFETLHLINSGIFKIVSLAPDGRERNADFFFDGDWLGFDGIPTGQHSCSCIALDIGEVWSVRYDALMLAAAKDPSLLRHVVTAISTQLARNRDIALSIGTLSADARVADFLLMWAISLAERGRRADEINVRMSRAEIGTFLCIRLESVSRALAKLAHHGVIAFNVRGRRDISIPDIAALSHFVQSDMAPSAQVLQ